MNREHTQPMSTTAWTRHKSPQLLAAALAVVLSDAPGVAETADSPKNGKAATTYYISPRRRPAADRPGLRRPGQVQERGRLAGVSRRRIQGRGRGRSLLLGRSHPRQSARLRRGTRERGQDLPTDLGLHHAGPHPNPLGHKVIAGTFAAVLPPSGIPPRPGHASSGKARDTWANRPQTNGDPPGAGWYRGTPALAGARAVHVITCSSRAPSPGGTSRPVRPTSAWSSMATTAGPLAPRR